MLDYVRVIIFLIIMLMLVGSVKATSLYLRLRRRFYSASALLAMQTRCTS